MSSSIYDNYYFLLNFRDTPDTIISSSSPEAGFAEKDADYPHLRLIEPASPGGVDDKFSPTVPLLHPIPIKLQPKVERMDVKVSF